MPAAGSDAGGATRHVGTPGGSGSGVRQGNRNATGQSRIARVPGGTTCSMGVSRGARGSVTRAVPPAPASTVSRTLVAPAGAITRVSPASVIRRVSVPKSSRTSSPGRSVPTVVTTTRSPRNGNHPVVTCWSTTRPGSVVPPMSTGTPPVPSSPAAGSVSTESVRCRPQGSPRRVARASAAGV